MAVGSCSTTPKYTTRMRQSIGPQVGLGQLLDPYRAKRESQAVQVKTLLTVVEEEAIHVGGSRR